VVVADSEEDFVGCMWISYYQCLLHLTDLLDRINLSLSKDYASYLKSREHGRLYDEIGSLVDAVSASVPFMLVGRRIHGNKPSGSVWTQARPPMLVGGLNLQWVLFTISILDIVPLNVKGDMKALLLWIGRNLGIRQATILAQMDKNLPGGITAKGDAMRWAGFFI
jgi:hypothetical protein